MNVVPLKQYSYLDWCQIAYHVNDLRLAAGRPLWTTDDAWHLWQAFFSEPA